MRFEEPVEFHEMTPIGTVSSILRRGIVRRGITTRPGARSGADVRPRARAAAARARGCGFGPLRWTGSSRGRHGRPTEHEIVREGLARRASRVMEELARSAVRALDPRGWIDAGPDPESDPDDELVPA